MFLPERKISLQTSRIAWLGQSVSGRPVNLYRRSVAHLSQRLRTADSLGLAYALPRRQPKFTWFSCSAMPLNAPPTNPPGTTPSSSRTEGRFCRASARAHLSSLLWPWPTFGQEARGSRNGEAGQILEHLRVHPVEPEE